MRPRKITGIAIATAVLAVAAGGYFLPKIKIHRHYSPTEVAPVAFANDTFAPNLNADGMFTVDVDPGVRRTPGSIPAIRIQGPRIPDETNAPPKKYDHSSYITYFITNGSRYMGQHVRVTGWLKMRDVDNRASIFLAVGIDKVGTVALDTMDNRPLSGTSDWQQIEIVTDIPNEPCAIYFGPDLYGKGALWADDFQMAIAPSYTPITDDRSWRQTSAKPNTYSESLDSVNKHDGHSTVCLACTGDDAAATNSWAWWGQKIRYPEIEKYRNHALRMSGWIRTEDVSVRLQPSLKPVGQYNYKILGHDSMVNNHSLKGTLGWTKFSVKCAVPKATGHVDTSFIFWGSGKVWIDMEELKFEVMK